MKLRNSLNKVLMLLATAFWPLIAAADSAAAAPKPEPLTELARQFIASQLPPASADVERRIDVADPDPRLRLDTCRSKIEGFWPGNGRRIGHTVIGLRCIDEGGWQVFLPAEIAEWRTVVVAARQLPRGKRLDENDLRLKKAPVSQLRGQQYTSKRQLLGASLRQGVNTETPITNQLVCVICRGDTVTIRAEGNDFAISAKGEAMSHGNPGDRIPVRNLNSRRTIQATVSGPNQVSVAL